MKHYILACCCTYSSVAFYHTTRTETSSVSTGLVNEFFFNKISQISENPHKINWTLHEAIGYRQVSSGVTTYLLWVISSSLDIWSSPCWICLAIAVSIADIKCNSPVWNFDQLCQVVFLNSSCFAMWSSIWSSETSEVWILLGCLSSETARCSTFIANIVGLFLIRDKSSLFRRWIVCRTLSPY